MKNASASGAAWLCIIGPSELERNTVTVKNLQSGEQSSAGGTGGSAPVTEIIDMIRGRAASPAS
jgi:histidyl-tRNA synthetase